MFLYPAYANRVHISRLHRLVSAYETNSQTVNELIESIKDAQKLAKNTMTSIIVDQDCLEHILVVFPSGRIALYREVCVYEMREG